MAQWHGGPDGVKSAQQAGAAGADSGDASAAWRAALKNHRDAGMQFLLDGPTATNEFNYLDGYERLAGYGNCNNSDTSDDNDETL